MNVPRNLTVIVFSLSCFALTNRVHGLEFFVTADTHFSYNRYQNEQNNVGQIRSMNALPGTSYTRGIGGTVGTPEGLLIAGDLTSYGRDDELREYREHYPVNGGTSPNVIHFPVHEVTGNHDCKSSGVGGCFDPQDQTAVHSAVIRRQGGLNYSWDWDGVHFIALDLYPASSQTQWLTQHLSEHMIAPQTPLVIMTHYGYTEWNQGWWGRRAADGGFRNRYYEESQEFYRALQGHNVIALIHGHTHRPLQYQWPGPCEWESWGFCSPKGTPQITDVYNVYSPGTPNNGSYAVVKIEGDNLTWAEMNWKTGKWLVDPVPEPNSILLATLCGIAMMMRRSP